MLYCTHQYESLKSTQKDEEKKKKKFAWKSRAEVLLDLFLSPFKSFPRNLIYPWKKLRFLLLSPFLFYNFQNCLERKKNMILPRLFLLSTAKDHADLYSAEQWGQGNISGRTQEKSYRTIDTLIYWIARWSVFSSAVFGTRTHKAFSRHCVQTNIPFPLCRENMETLDSFPSPFLFCDFKPEKTSGL